MTWLYESQEITEIPEEYAGFVYVITNKQTGRKYIGKKLSKFKKTTYKTIKLKNGKKKRKKIRGKIDSDWQTYYGSSPELTRDIEALGTENFTREILHWCKTKGTANYLELKEQILYGVLEHPDLYYNNFIGARIHRKHLKLDFTNDTN